MPERVWADRFFDSRIGNGFFDEHKDHFPAQFASTSVEKHNVFTAFFDRPVLAVVNEVILDVFQGIGTDWHNAFFVVFTDHLDEAHLGKKVGKAAG